MSEHEYHPQIGAAWLVQYQRDNPWLNMGDILPVFLAGAQSMQEVAADVAYASRTLHEAYVAIHGIKPEKLVRGIEGGE